MDCVPFKLGTEFLNKILAHMDLLVRPVLARACSSQPVTRRPALDREKVRVGFWPSGSESVEECLGFLLSLSFHHSISTCFLLFSLSEGRLVETFGYRGASDRKPLPNCFECYSSRTVHLCSLLPSFTFQHF
jgi:hypothetical protein